jgi:hypothetical protein
MTLGLVGVAQRDIQVHTRNAEGSTYRVCWS